MKRFTLVFAAFSMIFASCTKEIESLNQDVEPAVSDGVVLNINVAYPGADAATRAYIKEAWADNDEIKIWFDACTNETPDLVIKYDATTQEWSRDIEATPTPVALTNASGYAKSLYSGDVTVAAKDNYTYDSSTNSLTLTISNWTFLTKLQVVVTGISTSDGYTLACDQFTPYTGYTVGADGIAANEGARGAAVNGIANTDGVAFVFAESGLWDVNGSYAFTLTNATAEIAYTATTTINRPNGDNSKIKGLKVSASNFKEETTGSLNGHDWVKIGGVKWATMNVGATTVAGSLSTCAGDFFQWGSVSTIYENITWTAKTPSFTWMSDKTSGYVWDYVPFNGGYNDYNYTAWNSAKSSAIDSNNNLLFANDAARYNWGSSWRMPTSAEFLALYTACNGTDTPKSGGTTSTTAQGVYWCNSYDGVAGLLFIDGSGNKVFFPTPGYVDGTKPSYGGEVGSYWSSSLYAGSTDRHACNLYFCDVYLAPQEYDERSCAFSVRPVSD